MSDRLRVGKLMSSRKVLEDIFPYLLQFKFLLHGGFKFRFQFFFFFKSLLFHLSCPERTVIQYYQRMPLGKTKRQKKIVQSKPRKRHIRSKSKKILAPPGPEKPFFLRKITQAPTQKYYGPSLTQGKRIERARREF